MALSFAIALAACDSGAGTTSSSRGTPATTRARPADAWPTHGRDLINTRASVDELLLSPANVAQLTQVWATPNLRGMSSTPIVDGGVVYFGDWTGTARALDAATGVERWATNLQTYYIGGSVALDAERVFVPVFDGKIAALDRKTGKRRWTAVIDDTPGAAVFASPIVLDGMVIVGVASGQEFTKPRGATFKGHVVGLDVATGREVWRFWTTNNDAESGPGVAVWAAVSADPERHLVFVPTGNNYEPPSGPNSDAVVAVDSRTGQRVWVKRFTEGDVWTLGGEGHGPDADVGAPPNLFDVRGRAALGVGDKAGVFHALDRTTGEELWRKQLTKGGAQGGVMASGAVQGNRVYVTSNKGGATADLVALSTDDGAELWRVDVGGHSTGPVTWSNGLLLLGDDNGRVLAYAASDGTKLWESPLPGPSAGGVSVVNGTVFVGYGWWLAAPPPDPQGGLVAFRLPASVGGAGVAPTTAVGESRELGERVYVRTCASCHGGDGSGGIGPSLHGVAERLSVEEHTKVVRDGRNQMPPWAGVLSDDEMTAVIDYERKTFR